MLCPKKEQYELTGIREKTAILHGRFGIALMKKGTRAAVALGGLTRKLRMAKTPMIRVDTPCG